MRSNFPNRLMFTAAVLATLAACARGTSPFGAESTDEPSRLNVESRNLPIESGPSGSSVSSLAVSAPTLTLLASVLPPQVNGLPLQANSSASYLTNIYMSYNLAGAAAGGGIDGISLTVPTVPVLASSLQFPTLDVNNVHIANGAVYVAGNSSVDDAPARLRKYSLGLLGAIGSLVTDVALPGYAAVAVQPNLLGTQLHAVTGDNAGIQFYNTADDSLATYIPLADARDLSVNPIGNLYAVTGNDSGGVGHVKAYSAAGVALGSLSLGNTGVAQAKSTINAGLTYAIATAGAGGLRLICLANLQAVATAPAPTGGVTNAAVFTGGFIFAADGADGVTVYAVNQGLPIVGAVGCSNATLTKLGSVNFGTSVSANNISLYGTYLVVSGGLGGFKLVQLTLPALLTGLISTL